MKIKITLVYLFVLIFSPGICLSEGVSDMEEEKEVKVFAPPLAALLLRAEQIKGSHLSQEEVLRIGNEAPSIQVPESVAKASAKDRGYEDIDPNDIWGSWKELRETLVSETD